MQNLRMGIAIVILLFGIITVDLESWKWGVIGIVLFATPILLQFANSGLLQTWSLWFGLFLIIQSFILPPSPVKNDFKTLPKNLDIKLNVVDGLPGIHGLQSITTDSKGFRVTKPVDYDNTETIRLFAIGGSTTEDIYLGDKNTWTHKLQTLLSSKGENAEVVNAGVSGLRARHHLATFKNIIAYHPDTVIFLIGINDWNHHIKKYFNTKLNADNQEVYRFKRLFFRHTLLGRFIIQSLAKINTKIKILLEGDSIQISKAGDRPSVRTEHGEYYTKQRGSLNKAQKFVFKPEDVLDEYKQYLNNISDLCRKSGIQCIFVTQPNGYHSNVNEEYKKGFWMTPPNEPYTLDLASMSHIAQLYNKYLIQFAKQQQHDYCDIAKDIPATYEFFIDECHFNENGTGLVAKLISSCLRSASNKKQLK